MAVRPRGACEISQASRAKRLTEGVAINKSGIFHEGQSTGENATGSGRGN